MKRSTGARVMPPGLRAGRCGSGMLTADPGTAPSAVVFGWNIQQVVNVPAYTQTLPEK